MFDYEDQYCPACGLVTKEKRGHLYKCPKCGGQMRTAQIGGHADEANSGGRGLCYFFVFVILFAIGTVVTGIGGIPIAIIGVYLLKRSYDNKIKDKAILIK